MADPNHLTRLLRQAADGDAAAQHELAPQVYSELKRRAEGLMRREAHAQSLQATVLVSDAFMRLVHADQVDFNSRTHFYALASKVMRRVLVEHARSRGRQKRGGDVQKVSLDEALVVSAERDSDVLAVDAVLARLAEEDPRQAQIVELRFFGGLPMQEVADALGLSKRSCEREWTLIRAWMRRELSA